MRVITASLLLLLASPAFAQETTGSTDRSASDRALAVQAAKNQKLRDDAFDRSEARLKKQMDSICVGCSEPRRSSRKAVTGRP